MDHVDECRIEGKIVYIKQPVLACQGLIIREEGYVYRLVRYEKRGSKVIAELEKLKAIAYN